jgi:hypothetical protein
MDRRALLRKAAAAGAVGWTAPVILSSSPAAAGVFTAKCAPGNVTASASFVRTACRSNNSDISITINFSGPCPCGGTALWCAQKNSPTPAVSTTTSTLVFVVTIPIRATITISGRVGLGCTDRDGDTQFALYNWSMTATDNGRACSFVTNSISGVTLTGRTTVNSATCPPLTAGFAAPAILSAPSSGLTRDPEP